MVPLRVFGVLHGIVPQAVVPFIFLIFKAVLLQKFARANGHLDHLLSCFYTGEYESLKSLDCSWPRTC